MAKEIENEQSYGDDWLPSEAGNIGISATGLFIIILFFLKPQDTEFACHCLRESLETKHNKGACETTFKRRCETMT